MGESDIESGWSGSSLVRMTNGLVAGEADKNDTWLWRAIPFARPPVGELRWRAPREPENWDGVLSARSFGDAGVQYHPIFKRYILGNEDCLYLNVWRPQSVETELPVYVWIHGGGNSIGSATQIRDYYGDILADRNNLIFVSVNYRLGLMGWFSHRALREGADELDASGNYGTLDLIMALRWIQKNISAFGGDPGNVTIAGESAGGANVLSLLLSPLTDGLFHRAIVQSGFMETASLEDADSTAEEVLAALLIRDRQVKTAAEAQATLKDWPAVDIAAYLRSKTAKELLSCFESTAFGMIGSPKIFSDGTVIPENGYEAWEAASAIKDVPVIIGSNKDEIRLFTFMNRKLRRDRELYGTVADLGSDLWKARGVDGVAALLTAYPDSPPVYVYHFHWGTLDADGSSPLPGNWGYTLGAFHTLDVPFFLGSATSKAGLPASLVFARRNRSERALLAEAVMNYTGSFTRFGDPNTASGDQPLWPAWTVEEPVSMILDTRDGQPELVLSRRRYNRERIISELEAGVSEEQRARVMDSMEHWKKMFLE